MDYYGGTALHSHNTIQRNIVNSSLLACYVFHKLIIYMMEVLSSHRYVLHVLPVHVFLPRMHYT